MQSNVFKRNCPECKKEIIYISEETFRKSKPESKCRYCSNVLRGNPSNRRGCKHTEDSKAKISFFQTGIKRSINTRTAMSLGQKLRCSNPNEIRKMSERAKIAMHRPEVRRKHLNALAKTKWLIIQTDNGQLEILNKWNRLGFHFEPNYQVHMDGFLAYVDGYDPINNVVLEYDSKYHKSIGQQHRDKIREQKIINALQPKKFWRYNVENKTFKNVLEKA